MEDSFPSGQSYLVCGMQLGREEMEREIRRAVYFERDFPSHPQPQG